MSTPVARNAARASRKTMRRMSARRVTSSSGLEGPTKERSMFPRRRAQYVERVWTVNLSEDSGFYILGSRARMGLGGCADRLHDEVVAGAAAQVARDGLADLLLARPGILLEQRLGREQDAGG